MSNRKLDGLKQKRDLLFAINNQIRADPVRTRMPSICWLRSQSATRRDLKPASQCPKVDRR
jgi:hypothetical protein